MRLAKPHLVALLLVAVSCGDDPEVGPPRCDLFATASCIDGGRMHADVVRLAGPTYAGRRAGTPGNDLAVALVEERFAAAGLLPPAGRSDYRQAFSFDFWEPSATSLRLGDADVPLGSGYEVVYDSGSGTADADVVFVGYGLTVPAFDATQHPGCPFSGAGYDDYADVDVTGKVVVALRGTPGGAPIASCPHDPEICPSPAAGAAPGRCLTLPYYKAERAAANGAAGLLLVNPYRGATESAPVPFTSVWFERLPTLLVDRDTMEGAYPELPSRARAIDASLSPSSQATAVRASLSVAGAVETYTAANVIGVVPGSDPALRDEVIVVGAHLDHMGALPFRSAYFPGADDNASGTALLLELARAVAASPTAPRRTIVFAAWNAEELGLIGSCHYVFEEPLYPPEATAAAFSVDMVGAGSPGLELWGGTQWPAFVDATNAAAAELGLPWPVTAEPHLTASDHACFLEAGVPGFLASTPEILGHPDYHTAGDVAAGVSATNLEAAAKLLWVGVRELATGELGLR